MLAKLSFGQVLLDSIATDDAIAVSSVGIFNDLSALVADLSKLTDPMNQCWVGVAMQFHLVCQALLEIVTAEGGIFVMDLLGHQTNPTIIIRQFKCKAIFRITCSSTIRSHPCACSSRYADCGQIRLSMHDSTFEFYRGNAGTEQGEEYHFGCSLHLRLLHPCIVIVDWLIGLPHFGLIVFGDMGIGVSLAVAQLLFGILTINMKRSVLSLHDEMRLKDTLGDFSGLLLFLLQKIFQHSTINIYIKYTSNKRMDSQTLEEFCKIQLNTLFEMAYQCNIRVVGAIKEIFQHKRYIVQVYLSKKKVIRCLKRYSEFQALYEVINMNFKNVDLNLSEFPSKFQTRRHFFQQLLNRIVEIYCEKITNETNRRLLSTIYVFMVGEQAKVTKDRNSPFSDGSSIGQESGKMSSIKSSEEDKVKQLDKEYRMANMHKKVEEITIKSPQNTNNKLEKPLLENDEAKFRAFIGTEFLVRFQDESEWKERFLKLQNSCLLIYKHKNDNNFKTRIQLYQAKIDYLQRQMNLLDHFCKKMQLDNEATYMQDFSVLAISHEYDYRKLLIKVKEGETLELSLAKELLTKASHETANCQNIVGVFSPIGKVFIILHKIFFQSGNKKLSPIIHIRINTAGLTYETKRMNFNTNAPVNIKQGFLIPISNAFTNILIQVIMNQNDGIISHGTEEKCIGTYRLCFSDFISYPSGYGLEKIHAKPQLQTNQFQKYQSLLELSVINYSHFSSNYADSYANENDGIIMKGLKSTQDTELLVITVDRVLRVVGNIALFITCFWRNVYLFKYPRMGYTFFTILPLLILFGHAGLFFQMLVFCLITAMAYRIPFCNRFISVIMDDHVFKYRHQSFKQPLCIDSNQLKFIKWTQNLIKLKEDYKMTLQGKLQKREQAKNKKFQHWQFQIHQKVFKIKEELPSLLEKVFEVKKIIELVLRMINAVVNTVEKVCNVLSWADPRRSFIIFLVFLLISSIASSYLFRGIGIIFCIHRLYKGINFYQRKHYHNNRKLAIYCLRYVINKNFTYLLPSKAKKIETTDENQIVQALTEIFFPVRDQQAVRKLREEIEFVLGVFIDGEELLKREERKNQMRLYYLIEIIESCEARLKLQWISGAQGISQDFQQLKALTKQEVVIDLWAQSLLINFFWNIPSQLFTTFLPVRSSASLRCEKAKEKIGECFVKLSV